MNYPYLSRLLSCILLLLTLCGCSTVSSIRPMNSLRSILHLTLSSEGCIGSEEFEHTLDIYTDSTVTRNNELTILNSGNEYFPALLNAIDDACSYINISMYDFSLDNTGTEILEHLVAAAERGVCVRVTYDHFGCDTEREDFAPLIAAGGKVLTFNPLKSWTFLRMNNRNHRKLVVIDGNKAFLSGINFADNYNGDGFNSWHDSGILLSGPACYEVDKVFAQSWNQAGSNWLGMNLPIVGSNPVKFAIDLPFKKLFGSLYVPEDNTAPSFADVDMRIVEQSPEYLDSNLINLFVIAINAAQESVYIVTPYFLPPTLIQRAIFEAAQRGVDVRILTQEETDLETFNTLSKGEFYPYKKQGVRIWGWNKSILHNKFTIIDGKFLIGGSTNLDSRSLIMNYEVSFCTEDNAVIEAYTATFFKDLNLSLEYSLEDTKAMHTDKTFLFAPIRGQL